MDLINKKDCTPATPKIILPQIINTKNQMKDFTSNGFLNSIKLVPESRPSSEIRISTDTRSSDDFKSSSNSLKSFTRPTDSRKLSSKASPIY